MEDGPSRRATTPGLHLLCTTESRRFDIIPYPLDMGISPQSEVAVHARGVMQVRPGVELAGLSDIGCQRQNNEDQYAYWEPAGDEEFARKGRLAIVADGMGGHEGGQEASRIAVETIQEVFAETPGGDPQSLLLSGFQTAHQRIVQYADGHP